MGLDAHVFKSKVTLDAEFGPGRFDIDPPTGEPLSRAGERSFALIELVAAHHRLGNLSEIGALRSDARDILGGGPWLVLDRVLYSGAHTGDHVPVAQLSQLRSELQALRGAGGSSVLRFVEQMELLIDAAERERNPIVF